MRALLISLVFMLAAPVLAQDEAATIEAWIRPHADSGLFSGVVLVARGDEVLLQQSWGYANWELRAAISPATRFGIGSITKPMTVHIVDSLVAVGTIALDDPIDKFIPGFPTGPAGGKVTVEHLVDHRSGVPHRVTSAADETQVTSAAGLVGKVLEAGLLFEPGSGRLYSSAGYTVLARVLEVASGMAYEELVSAYVFEPANMSGAQNESGQRLMNGRALPYRLGADDRNVVVRNAPFKDLRFLTGAGSVYATATDMLRYANAVRAGRFGDAARSNLLGDDPADWAGIYGRTNGFEASVDVLDGDDLVFVLLTNLQSATTGQVRMGVRAILTGDVVDPIPMPPPVGEQSEPPGDIVGIYGRAEIHFFGGALFRGENEFYPTGSGYYIPGSGTRMSFRRNADGAVDALVSTSLGGRESVLPRSAD